MYWLPSQDSNLGKRIQSPSCYRYTTRQQKFYIIKLQNGAEGRGRTDTRVAPQQFLRLSRLPIPPLRLDITSLFIKEHNNGAEAQDRTGDTRIFSPLLYRLSYLGLTG